MKLTNNRLYLDYNSTAPLADEVVSFISKGAFFYANCSSAHTTGRQAQKELNETKSFLYRYFGLEEKSFEIVFHSGATEALNTFLKQEPFKLAHFTTDHATVFKIAEEIGGKKISLFSRPDLSFLDSQTILNGTWVNNEVGFIHDLKDLLKIKNETGCIIHVDGAQAIGKIKNDHQLDPNLDIYTFSGHKFGALPGSGFSFYKRDLKLSPLLTGSFLHGGLRSGTVNLLGVKSIEWALKDLEKNLDKKKMESFQKKLIELINSNSNLTAVTKNGDAFNIVNFYHQSQQSAQILPRFDLAGIDISSGAACSSGTSLPSRILCAMGHEKFAKNSIRISWGMKSLKDEKEIFEKLDRVISQL